MISTRLNNLLIIIVCLFLTGCKTPAETNTSDNIPVKSYIAEGFINDNIDYINSPISEKFKAYDFSSLPHNDGNPDRKFIIKLVFTPRDTEDVSFFLPSVFYPIEIFINGHKIFRSGLQGRGESYGNFYGAIIQLPEVLLKKNKPNTIAIRLYPKYEKRSFKNVLLGPYKKIRVHKFWYSFFHCTITSIFSFISLVYFIIFFLLWMSGSFKTRTYLYFSFICLALAFSFINMIFSGINVSEIMLTKIGRAASTSAAILLFLFSVEYTGLFKNNRYFSRLIFGLVLSVIIAFLFYTETRQDIKNLFGITRNFIISPILLSTPFMFVISWFKTKKTGTLIIMLSIFVLVAASLHDVYYLNQLLDPYIWFLPIGFSVVELAISIILALDQAYMTKKIAIQARDISIANKNLLRAKNIAESANKAKTGFLAKMGHEFRTPLNGIDGALQLLKDISNKDSMEYINSISISSKRLMVSINEIIDYSELDGGSPLELNISTFNLKKRIDAINDLIKDDILTKNIEFIIKIDDSLPSIIEGDEKRIQRIILNLLENSIKFTKEGSILLEVSYADNSQLKIIVEDTGRGIPESKLNHIFNAFEQCESDHSFTRDFEGLGLGLAITARTVQNMNGSISAESKEGKGSRFTVIIPAKKIDYEKNYLKDLSNLNALIIEDNEINARILSTFLKKLGIDSDFAENGRVGVDKYLKEKYNIIFMDVQMPEMNGLEATRAIRASETSHGSRVPIIGVTANAKRSDCINAGMDAFIQKPVTKEVILETIIELFDTVPEA